MLAAAATRTVRFASTARPPPPPTPPNLLRGVKAMIVASLVYQCSVIYKNYGGGLAGHLAAPDDAQAGGKQAGGKQAGGDEGSEQK